MYIGLIKLGANLTFYANTHTPSTGAAVDADAVPGYRVYEDETATPLLTGSMALLDDANTVGFYSEQIAVTTANGFEAGKSYSIRITGVVGGVTGVEIHQFDVQTRISDDLAYPATSGRSMVVDTAGLVDANVVKVGPTGAGTAQTARDIGASVLLSSGTGTGQLDFTSGVVKSNLSQILGTALTETAGQIAAAFKKFFDKAAPTGTVNSLPDAVAGAAGGVFIAGTNAATSITTALTANITGNLSGSVGSLTTNNDKTGYSLAATGLDSITATRPAAVATTFPQMVVQLFYRFFGKSTLTATQLKTYAANGTTVVTTQTVSDDNITQTQGEAS